MNLAQAFEKQNEVLNDIFENEIERPDKITGRSMKVKVGESIYTVACKIDEGISVTLEKGGKVVTVKQSEIDVTGLSDVEIFEALKEEVESKIA